MYNKLFPDEFPTIGIRTEVVIYGDATVITYY